MIFEVRKNFSPEVRKSKTKRVDQIDAHFRAPRVWGWRS